MVHAAGHMQNISLLNLSYKFFLSDRSLAPSSSLWLDYNELDKKIWRFKLHLISLFHIWVTHQINCSHLSGWRSSPLMVLFYHEWSLFLPAGPSACREVLRLPSGHRRHVEGHGGFRLRAWQEAQGDHGRWQTGDTCALCFLWTLWIFLSLLFWPQWRFMLTLKPFMFSPTWRRVPSFYCLKCWSPLTYSRGHSHIWRKL